MDSSSGISVKSKSFSDQRTEPFLKVGGLRGAQSWQPSSITLAIYNLYTHSLLFFDKLLRNQKTFVPARISTKCFTVDLFKDRKSLQNCNQLIHGGSSGCPNKHGSALSGLHFFECRT